VTRTFEWFVAIDWSGAKGKRHKSIALAVAHHKGGAPVLVHQKRGWARSDILTLLRDGLPNNTLVGMDLGISLPFVDKGAFFPGWEESPPDAPSLWAMIDRICRSDQDFAASSFVDHPQASAHFRRHGGREGAQFGGGRGRFRVAEFAQEAHGCKPYSNFNLVGAAQVGKSSLTGMRILNQLRGHLPVWPIDPLPQTGSVVVEIYTALAAIAAGRKASGSKMRSYEELNKALSVLKNPAVEGTGPLDDHATDAILTAAWMRANACRGELWAPKSLTGKIAATEGWTFGVT